MRSEIEAAENRDNGAGGGIEPGQTLCEPASAETAAETGRMPKVWALKLAGFHPDSPSPCEPAKIKWLSPPGTA